MQLNYKQTNEITLIMCLSFNLSELVDKQLFSKYEKRCQKKTTKNVKRCYSACLALQQWQMLKKKKKQQK